MMNVTSVKRIHQSDWTDSGVRFLRARDIVAAAKNEEPDDYLYISKEKYEEYSALSGKVGVSDLLVTGVGTIGVPYLVRNLEPLYFKDGNIIWFQNSDKIDGKFLFYSFSAEQIQGFINESAGIGTVGTYTIESGKKTPISLPNQIEQAKVGEFFQQLDNLITLHQRQHFLHSTPDISLSVRLIHPFYTSSWEQRKLGELVDRVVRKNINNESTLPLTISAQYGLVDQITYFNNRVASRDVSNYYLVLNGEFAYNKSTSDGYPFGAVKRLDLYEKGVLSTLYIVFAPKKEQQIDSDYLTVFFDTDRWHKGVAERAAEGARNHGLLNISAEDFFDIDLSVPKDIVEQKQIGAFIRQLDNLITLHQRKGKAAVSGCSNDANNSKGVCCKARDFGYKCHKKDEPNRFDA
jgi:type I restriction enzyme S subunit